MADDITQRHYAKRDHMAQGDYYTRHVSAMTGEDLHRKSAIAAELAHRDMLVDALRARVAELEAEVQRLRADARDDEATRATMADLLSRTAIALRGPEPPLTRWSWHDLPDRAAAAIAAIDVVHRAAIDALQARIDAKRKEG